MERRLLWAGVGDADLHQQVVRVGLGMQHVDDPVAVLVERSGVEQLVLGLSLVTATVLRDQVGVGKLRLWVVVTPTQQSVTGKSVQEPPVLLDVFTVVALRAGQTEHPLLQHRIPTVPQGERQAQVLPDVTDTRHAVLTPPVGPRAGMVMRKVVPRRPVSAVVLPNGPPRPLGQIWTPVVPRRGVEQA